jgi:hypothetical protein
MGMGMPTDMDETSDMEVGAAVASRFASSFCEPIDLH